MFIVCEECKESLHIGQTGMSCAPSPDIFYSGEPEIMQELEDFLFKHETQRVDPDGKYGFDDKVHTLKFISEHHLYTETKEDEGWDWAIEEQMMRQR